jgi:hypothetical protein
MPHRILVARQPDKMQSRPTYGPVYPAPDECQFAEFPLHIRELI